MVQQAHKRVQATKDVWSAVAGGDSARLGGLAEAVEGLGAASRGPAQTADADAAADQGISRRLTVHMPAAIRMARPAAHDQTAADVILDFTRGLAAGPAASWSHACPWGAEIRLAPHAAAAGGAPAASCGAAQRKAA